MRRSDSGHGSRLTGQCTQRTLTGVNMTLGTRIRELRDAQDLSLREFAKKLDLAPAFISDIEHGRRYPSEEVLARMARLLETSVGDLKAYDQRPPIEALKRQGQQDPQLAVALRRVVDQNVSGDELLEFLNGRKQRPGKQ